MITNTELELKGNQFPSQVISYEKKINILYFKTVNGLTLELTIVRDSLLRFRYLTDSNTKSDFSYAIAKSAKTGHNHLEIAEEREQ